MSVFFTINSSAIFLIIFPIAFNWSKLPEGALVVDVGGGIGTASIQVAKQFPSLKFIVQDRRQPIADGIQVRF